MRTKLDAYSSGKMRAELRKLRAGIHDLQEMAKKAPERERVSAAANERLLWNVDAPEIEIEKGWSTYPTTPAWGAPYYSREHDAWPIICKTCRLSLGLYKSGKDVDATDVRAERIWRRHAPKCMGRADLA